MFFEAEFWVAVAFLVFVAIVWKVGGFKALTEGLDSRGKRIQAELDEAKRLREEAAGVLADYKRRRGEAEREAAEILSAAREEAERTAEEAHRRLEDFIRRRTAAAETKIAQAEAQATAEVRAAAADAAIQVSETVLREKMTGEAAQSLIAQSLADVRRKLNS
ncbi:MAG TPA: ATP F0F1 synthase subunit B [Beijerinckiaceae bacterium]|jgi:F-type H+-transporting ATPase subunit b